MQDCQKSPRIDTSGIAIWRTCGLAVGRASRIIPFVSVGVIGVSLAFGAAPTGGAQGGAGSEADGGESGGADDGDGGSCAGGDCGEDNSKQGEANDPGDGEACRDEDTCPCDTGNGGQGVQAEVTGPDHIVPVSWSTGEKWETEVDLRVKLKGADFRLTRQYSSDPYMFIDIGGNLYDNAFPTKTYLGAALTSIGSSDKVSIGEGWSFSNLRAMTARISQSCEDSTCPPESTNPTGYSLNEEAAVMGWLLRPARKPRQFAIGVSGINPPGNQGISIVDVTSYGATTGEYCIDCADNAEAVRNGFFSGTIRFGEPGRWHQDFAITGGFGFISSDVDEYGNRRDYVDTGSDGIPDIIYLNGDSGNPANNWEAKVSLKWATNNSQPVLSRAEVYRSGVTAPTQIVAYYHLDDDSGLKVKAWNPVSDTWAAVSGLTPHWDSGNSRSDLGTDGDLVQVVRYTAINPTQTDVQYRALVSQYRYHDSRSAPSVGTDIRLRTLGLEHQVKMEFMPQQIEFLAQDASTTMSPVADELDTSGGGSWASWSWSESTLVSEALELLELADSATVPDTSHDVFESAEKIISYTASTSYDSTVEFQFLQATSCGCGGSGSTSAVARHYEMIEGWSAGGSLPDGRSMHIAEFDLTSRTLTDDFPWEDTTPTPYRTFCYDMLMLGADEDYPYVWMKAVIEGDSGDAWVTKKEYNLSTRTVSGMSYPSSVASYTKASGGGSPSAPSLTAAAGGMQVSYDYPTGNENVATTAILETNGLGTGTPVDVVEVEYEDHSEEREFLPKVVTRHRVASPANADEKEVTSYYYGYEDDIGSAKLDWRMIERERELTSENGPSGSGNTVEEWEFYDDQGLLIVHMDGGGMVTRFEYNSETGQLAKVTRNYDPTSVSLIFGVRLPDSDTATDDDIEDNPFSGMSSPSDGALITEYEYDKLGRLTKVTRPGGVESWTVREMREDDAREGMQYFAKVSLPHNISTSTPKTFNGPAHVRYIDGAGDVTRRETYELSTTASYDPDASTPTYTLSTEIGRSTVTHGLSGSVTSSSFWWDVSGNEFYTASTEHDAFGRVSKVTDGNGTVTERLYDVMDRVTSVKVGTSSGTNTVAEYYYDGDPAATPASGVGNGNLTAVVMKDGVGDRITRMYYDYRDRQIATVPPDAPMTIVHYDHLNRPVEQGIYPEPTSAPFLSNIRTFAASSLANDGTGLNLPSGEKRSWYTKTDYSQRGMVYRQLTAIDPTLSTGLTYLEWNAWYDEEGHELASWGPNAPISVTEYDELDRVEKVMIADRTVDTGTSAWDFEAATSVVGDYVLEQSEYRYESGSGLLDLVTSRMALHDNSTTGSLTGSNAVTTYRGYIYDTANRGIATVSFGTNKTGTNPYSSTVGTVPTLTDYDELDELREADDLLYSWRTYNTRGLVEDMIGIQELGTVSTTSAADLTNRYLYDDLSRSIAMIENADAVSSVTWDSSLSVYRYTVSGFDYTKPDTDRVTSFVYDGANNIVKRVAHIPENNGSGGTAEAIQETAYFYGVSAGSSANIMDSLVSSNNLLAQVWYPNEDTGKAYTLDAYDNPETDEEYKVKYAYNRLGELRGVTDQNGTIRNIVRDQAGRVTRDIASTLGTGVDSTIRMLEYEFDSNGRLVIASSYEDTGAITIRDQVELGYTGLWQIETLTQQHDDEVDSSSPQLLYRYDTQPNTYGTENYSRVIEMVYPTDNEGDPMDHTVVYTYDDTGVDDNISRVTSIGVSELTGSAGIQDLIKYDRIGLGMTAIALMPNVNDTSYDGIQLDRTVEHNGTRTSGKYPAFDKYGRIVRHMWVREDFTTGTGGLSNQPAVVEVIHSYDRMSNRLSCQDRREGARLEDRNRAFGYDGLNRLIDEIRLDPNNTGPTDDTLPLPPSSTYASQHYSREWDLDMLGNWPTLTADADEDGYLNDAQGNGHLDSRGANYANEYEGELHAQYDRRVSQSSGYKYHDYAYDKNGNLTEERTGTALPTPPDMMAGLVHTYDAWNRLVKSEFEPTSGSNITISENTYNALGWRTSKKLDTATGAYDGQDQERLFLYDASWRIVEEHIDTDNNGTIDWKAQEFWGLRYIDDSVARRIDRDTDGDKWVDAETSVWYRATDTQFSVVAVIAADGDIYERIEYDAYGNARHRYYGDVDGDGVYTTTDLTVANASSSPSIGDSDYHADLDLDFSGGTDLDEVYAYSSAPSPALPDGWISDPGSSAGPDNSIGYAGYVINPEREDYLSRHRNYAPELGMWMQRDPIGFEGGVTLYLYVDSSPVQLADPSGLSADLHDLVGAYVGATLDCGGEKKGIHGFMRVSALVCMLEIAKAAGCCVKSMEISTHHVPGTFYSKSDGSDGVSDQRFADAIKPCKGAKIELNACNTRECAKLVLNNANDDGNYNIWIEWTDGFNYNIPHPFFNIDLPDWVDSSQRGTSRNNHDDGDPRL